MAKGRHILITGGVRCGKSAFGEKLAASLDGPVIYVATAQALDNEMKQRIAGHRRRRPSTWETVEEPLNIPPVLDKHDQPGLVILWDCLTLYLANLFLRKEPPQAGPVLDNVAKCADAVEKSRAHIIIVTNEVGWGIVPENALAREFRDLSGMANQIMARISGEVYLMVCGIPVQIKGESVHV